MELNTFQEKFYNEFEKYDLCNWTLKIINSKRKYGHCRWGKNEIAISKKFVAINNWNQMKQCILHEIAHALVGSKAKHGKEFKDVCEKIGCMEDGCYTKARNLNVPKSKYTIICKTCGRTQVKNRKRRSPVACSKCCKKYNNGIFSDKYLLEYVENK